MNAASRKCSQPTLGDIPSVTSSRALVDGPLRSSSQDGPVIDQSGQEAAHVNHSPREATVKVRETAGICGPLFSSLSKSANLCASLGNRLKEQLSSSGSMGYRQTWKAKTTPLGLPYLEHTARLYPTLDSDFTGLPTPTVNAILEKTCPKEDGRVRFLPSGRVRKSSKKGKQGSMNWSQDVLLRGYLPTPRLCLFLMGFPDTWHSCGVQAMQSYRKSQRRSFKRTSKQGEGRQP